MATVGGATLTVAASLFGPSVPVHAFRMGVTVYFHEPLGTPFSVQLVDATVPAQAAPTLRDAFVDALYDLTT
jgi:hypothetical protein